MVDPRRAIGRVAREVGHSRALARFQAEAGGSAGPESVETRFWPGKGARGAGWSCERAAGVTAVLDAVEGLSAPNTPDLVIERCAQLVWRHLNRPAGCVAQTEREVFVIFNPSTFEVALDEAGGGPGWTRVLDALEAYGSSARSSRRHEPSDGSLQPALRYRVLVDR